MTTFLEVLCGIVILYVAYVMLWIVLFAIGLILDYVTLGYFGLYDRINNLFGNWHAWWGAFFTNWSNIVERNSEVVQPKKRVQPILEQRDHYLEEAYREVDALQESKTMKT